MLVWSKSDSICLPVPESFWQMTCHIIAVILIMPKENNKSTLTNRKCFLLLLGFASTVTLLVYLVITTTKPHITSIGKAHAHFNNGQESTATKEQNVLEGTFSLVDLILPDGLPLTGVHYHAIGVFCPLDWNLQQKNPSTVPMFRDLIRQSPHCHHNTIHLDLYTIVQATRQHDQNHNQNHDTTAKKSEQIHPLAVSGFVFHETRCGSTLVANILAASTHHRVYSEAGPPLTALQQCHGNNKNNKCNQPAHDALLKDVFFMMTRSNLQQEHHVFFKFQSIAVHHMSLLTRLFPTTPWIFVFRNTLEIIMSHLKTPEQTKAVCLRSSMQGGPTTTTMSPTERCAAHLATLCRAALEEYQQSPNPGYFVNFDQLPNIMWDVVLPQHFGIPNNKDDQDQMMTVANVYSKGRGDKANQIWKGDTKEKQKQAWDLARVAADTFVQSSLESMQTLSQDKYMEQGQ